MVAKLKTTTSRGVNNRPQHIVVRGLGARIGGGLIITKSVNIKALNLTSLIMIESVNIKAGSGGTRGGPPPPIGDQYYTPPP